MTCNGCVAKVKSELLKLGDVLSADVQLQSPQATISMGKHISTDVLQQAISKAGNYSIEMEGNGHSHQMPDEEAVPKTWLQTYIPLLLVFGFILGISLITAWQNGRLWLMPWMNNFMAGFFIAFSFFKLLNLRGFADSYSSYDVLAKKWYGYGYVYPFIELALGVAYLTGFNPQLVNIATVLVMGFSSIGVIQAVTNKRKIQCACLGAVFNLPMSTVTIVEDLLMAGMALWMLFLIS